MTILNHFHQSDLARDAYFFLLVGNTKYCSCPKRCHVGIRQQRSINQYFREMAHRALIRVGAQKQKYFLSYTVVNESNLLL